MMVAEIAAGYWTGSMALLADGFHMATHAGALGLAALAYRYAKKHRHDPRYSFGTGKVGDLTGFASALILGIFAIGIAVESFLRLRSEEHTSELQSLMRISYAVFCFKKKKHQNSSH